MVLVLPPGDAESPDEIAQVDVEKSLHVAQSGSSMRLVKFRKLGSANIVKLNAECTQVSYSTHGSVNCFPTKFKNIPVSEILEVRSGWATDNFHKTAAKAWFSAKVRETCCFSVVFRHHQSLYKSIDLVTDTTEVQTAWVIALRHLVANIKKEALHFNEEHWLKLNFNKADLNKNGCLSFKEVFALLNQLNLEISQEYAKQIYTKADFRKSSTKVADSGLEFDEFLIFFRFLTKRLDLLQILRDHTPNNTVYFGPADLKNFIENVQKEPPVTIDECKKLIHEFEPDDVNKKEFALTSNGLRRFMLDPKWGSIFNQDHGQVFQDMSLPLANYYVNSSHNTYLSGHQLAGDATIEGYINTLKHGFRLLELDVWDSDQGPTITHGHTLVNPIRFRDVIKAIKDYAFATTPYPVILSLENHCCTEQQSQMATILHEVLGKKIYVPPPGTSQFPSPEYLKGKFLVKGKVAPIISPSAMVTDVTSVKIESDEQSPDIEFKGKVIVQKTFSFEPTSITLSNLVGLANCKIKNIASDVATHPFNGIATVKENKMEKMLQNNFDELVKYTSRHMVKVYPDGMRTSSSNYNPMESWTAGAQCVSINAQTYDEGSDLNHGLFKLNGQCGYVLKPEMLRFGLLSLKENDDAQVQLTIELRVISAQYLPKPVTAMTSSDVIDPFVSVEVFGLPCDKRKRQTRTIDNNGFNPIWNESFTFDFKAPEFALLRFSVKDYDRFSANDFIGEYTVPVNSIREGYRIMRLHTGSAHRQDATANLMAHTKIIRHKLVTSIQF